MKYLITLLIFTVNINALFSQDLEDILETETDTINYFETATFKGTRIVTAHSVETRRKGEFEFMISHRFGRVNSGFDNLFGLDDSNIRFAIEYALSDKLTVALGRSSYEKTYDSYLKYRLLRQQKGSKNTPISLTYFGSVALKTIKDYLPENEPTFTQKLAYTNQLLIARKINSKLSIQLSPTYIHFNNIKFAEFNNDIYAIGFGSRYKINSRFSVNFEYFYNLNSINPNKYNNALSIGVDIQTGGHVFQIILSNSRTMNEKSYIAENDGKFFKGDIHLGFNISRLF